MISLRFKWVVSPLFYLVLLSTVFDMFIIVNVDKTYINCHKIMFANLGHFTRQNINAILQ